MELNARIITNKGDINIKLMPEIAPITVANFVSLIRKNFYDNIIFHRVIEDFIQQVLVWEDPVISFKMNL